MYCDGFLNVSMQECCIAFIYLFHELISFYDFGLFCFNKYIISHYEHGLRRLFLIHFALLHMK